MLSGDEDIDFLHRLCFPSVSGQTDVTSDNSSPIHRILLILPHVCSDHFVLIYIDEMILTIRKPEEPLTANPRTEFLSDRREEGRAESLYRIEMRADHCTSIVRLQFDKRWQSARYASVFQRRVKWLHGESVPTELQSFGRLTFWFKLSRYMLQY